MFGVLLSAMALFKQNISFSTEYILFVLLIVLGSYLLASSTNLFLSIFLLEFLALLIFGKMTVSRASIKQTVINKINQINKKNYSYGLFNSLFFQFWANFASSIFLLFSLSNLHYSFGTSNFFVTNFLLSLINTTFYLTPTFIFIILTILLTGLFIKLGLSPYQFFKIETYKGIPIFIVIVYTTVYLITYIYFFLVLLLNHFSAIRIFASSYIIFVITISVFYLVSLLFDTKNFKAFLAYSTLITLSNLFVIILIL